VVWIGADDFDTFVIVARFLSLSFGVSRWIAPFPTTRLVLFPSPSPPLSKNFSSSALFAWLKKFAACQEFIGDAEKKGLLSVPVHVDTLAKIKAPTPKTP